MGAAAGVRVVRYKGHDIKSRMFKNRDKQMTFIVRVISRPFFELIIRLALIVFIFIRSMIYSASL